MGRHSKWLNAGTGKVHEAEKAKRARLLAEIAELSKPAFGVHLRPKEKEAIAERVRTAQIAQSLFPRGGGAGAKASD